MTAQIWRSIGPALGSSCDSSGRTSTKSRDGTKHPAHAAVLSAARVYFKTLLGGSFEEAERAEVSLELLDLADRWDFQKFTGAIEVGIRASLDHSVALQVLPRAWFSFFKRCMRR